MKDLILIPYNNLGIDIGITIRYLLSMKTAISIPDELFKEVEKFAQKYNYSRSEVFVIAIRGFLRKLESKKLLDAINEAYSVPEPVEEQVIREKSKKHYARTVIKERY